MRTAMTATPTTMSTPSRKNLAASKRSFRPSPLLNHIRHRNTLSTTFHTPTAHITIRSGGTHLSLNATLTFPSPTATAPMGANYGPDPPPPFSTSLRWQMSRYPDQARKRADQGDRKSQARTRISFGRGEGRKEEWGVVGGYLDIEGGVPLRLIHFWK